MDVLQCIFAVFSIHLLLSSDKFYQAKANTNIFRASVNFLDKMHSDLNNLNRRI